MIKGEYTGDLLIDMAFLPHNLKRLHRYGLSDLKAIVVDRDLRDVFSYINHNKMILKRRPQIPMNIDDFIKFWLSLRQSEVIVNENVLRLRFEDLVYNYEKTIRLIESFLEISDKTHTNRLKYFNPETAKNNTQLFRAPFVNQEHIDQITKELDAYIYDFPYNLVGDEQKEDLYFGDMNRKAQ